jgi:toxin ParE1/3/4
VAYRVSPEASADLDEIWYHIATEGGGPTTADGAVDAITQRFLLLATHPHIGRRRDDLRTGLRCFAVRPWLIYYRSRPPDVFTMRVLHGRRDIKAAFDFE